MSDDIAHYLLKDVMKRVDNIEQELAYQNSGVLKLGRSVDELQKQLKKQRGEN